MKKKLMVSLVIVFLLAAVWSTPSFAQEDSGYPIDDPTQPPAPTTVPTQAPTKPPTQQPTQQPTAVPTEVVNPTIAPTLTPIPTDSNAAYPAPTDKPTPMPTPPHSVCELTRINPALMVLSYRFEVPYETLVTYYCEMNLGVGEIALALITLNHIEDQDVTFEDILSLHLEAGMDWGEIWYWYDLENPMSSNEQESSLDGGIQGFHRRQRPQSQTNDPQPP